MAGWQDDPVVGGGGSNPAPAAAWQSDAVHTGPLVGDVLAQARRNAGPGASEAEIRELAASMQPKTAAQPAPPAPEPPAPQRSLPEQFGRGLMMIPQGVNKGIANTAGAVGDLGNAAYHAIGQSDLPQNFFTRMATKLLVGEPGSPRRIEPENTVERGIEGTSQGGAEAATMALGGGGLAALRNLPKVGSIAGVAGDFMRTAPGMQVASGAAGGGVTEATGDPNLGLAASLAVPGGLGAARRVVQPIRNQRTPEGRELVQDAQGMGIPLTAGEITGSKPLQVVESTLERMPLTSGPQAEIKQKQQRAFNSASLDASHTPGDIASPVVLKARRGEIGDVMGDTRGRTPLDPFKEFPTGEPPAALGQEPPTTTLAAQLQDIGEQASQLATQPKPLLNQTRSLVQHIRDGTIDGKFVSNWDTETRKLADGYATDNPDLADRLRKLNETVRDAHMASMAPEDAAAYRQARRDYANLHVTIDAAAGAGEKAAEGNVPPKALRGALIKSVGEVPYALGEGDQNRQARVGQDLLREPVGDSGTATRNYAIQLLTGAPLMTLGASGGYAMGGGPLAAAGAVGGLVLPRAIQAGMNTKAGQAYLARGIPGLRDMLPDNPSSMVGNMNRALADRLVDPNQRDQLSRDIDMARRKLGLQ